MDTSAHTARQEWIDLKQAAREYPLSKRTFWKLIAEGRLAVYRPFARKVLLKRSEIDRLIESTRVTDPGVVVGEPLDGLRAVAEEKERR